MERINDVRLIQDTLSGDDAAFNTLVQKYQKSVHALVWRKIGDFHHAEEVTQDTFLQAYKKLSTLKNPNQFAGWLYVIASRLCLNWGRKKKLTVQSLEGLPVDEIERSSYKHYMLEQQQKENAERHHEIVKKLLSKLPESERTVVTLYYLGEMTTKEIGKFLGVSVNTIASRLRRGRKRLQEQQVETLVQEILGAVPVPASLTQNIMRQVADMKTTPHPIPKPVTPWLAFGTAVLLITLLFGTSNRYLAHFQKPYSFQAKSEPTIEIIEASVVLKTNAKRALRNQVGRADASSKSTGTSLRMDERASTASAQENSRNLSETQWMPDAALRAAIREELALPEAVPLTKDRMQELQHLKAGSKGITDIKGLEFARNLVNLHLGDEGNYITDLSPLATLTSLINLNVGGNQITDISPLGSLTSLAYLNLANNRVSNLSLMTNLISLKTLDLFANEVKNVVPLSGLRNLKQLILTSNHIEDINPLSELTNLRILWIKGNPIKDLSPLVGLNLTDLKYDDISLSATQSLPSKQSMPDPTEQATAQGDLGLLSRVPLTKEKRQRLEWQNANHNSINNTSGLEFNTNLRELRLGKNPIIDAHLLANLTRLEQLNFWRIPQNPMALDLRPLINFANLEGTSVEKNGISDIRPLAGLTHLQRFWMKRNRANAISQPPELNLTERTFWAFP